MADHARARFHDRSEAGKNLAERLETYAGRKDVIVLALPRGGVPVGFEIAKALRAPLDVLIVRKLGVPGQEELAFGAIASGGMRILNDEIIREIGLSGEWIEKITAREQKELERREQLYRNGKPPPAIDGRTVILVDDGLATGASMQTAIAAVRGKNPKSIIVALPVAPASVYRDLKKADEVICLLSLEFFFAVSVYYEKFQQTSDGEVKELLRQAETFA